MRLCDPYQLFQKIEDELCSMVLESRIRQLNLLKDETNPALAEEFITGKQTQFSNCVNYIDNTDVIIMKSTC